jgi:hypothetical protein
VHGEGRNTRGPSAPLGSEQGRAYKPMAKTRPAQRASEGVVVPRIVVTTNATGGKGPCGGQASGEGTCEGLAGKTGPNSPDGRPPIDKVRHLQRSLWAAAKRSPERRFHALLDRIWRPDILQEAWARVRRNRGAAGVDRETLAAVEQYGVERMLSELGVALHDGTYRPQPVLRRYTPKADGRQRPLGIPTVRDRVAQMAAKLVLEPIFEADFRPSSFGFRPKRSATQALEVLRVHGARGGNHVLDADIRDYFGSIDQTKLMRLLEQRISDRRVLKLLRQWLDAGVSTVLTRLGLERHPEKTRTVDLSWGREGFDFLGSHLRKRMSGPIWERSRQRVYFLQRWPSQRAMQRVRTRLRELTPRGRCHEDLRPVIADVNAVVRGWGQSFRTGNAATRFIQLDRDVDRRLRGLLRK